MWAALNSKELKEKTPRLKRPISEGAPSLNPREKVVNAFENGWREEVTQSAAICIVAVERAAFLLSAAEHTADRNQRCR